MTQNDCQPWFEFALSTRGTTSWADSETTFDNSYNIVVITQLIAQIPTRDFAVKLRALDCGISIAKTMHCYILLIVHPDHKPKTPGDYDTIVSIELPD
ncbi:hypothetical protein KI688_002272 [Linnemannia hyalina]|uniref:Uncharacterized protein n=1 Tax=Linnemannia hyalina TaxID=64524 RepID=A0A9P7XRG3_9FUNG|nr:hypothetical protein KI688_002272 [Linnemannia hyalina]